MKRLFRLILLTLLPLNAIFSEEPIIDKEAAYEPIFAGTLLSIMSLNLPPGSWLLEPYLFAGEVNGVYDSHWKTQHTLDNFEVQLLWLVETGLTPWLDISLYVNGDYTSSHDKKSYLYGDTKVALGFQACKNQRDSWIPDLRFLLLQNFPSGKYQHLNPRKSFADVSGSGAYETWLIAVARKIVYFTPKEPITLNLTLQYDFPSNVHVSSYNLYGGTAQTNGTVKPGRQFVGNFGIEYSFTIHWILGLDIHYTHQNNSIPQHRHHQNSPIGLPSSEQFSLAPCIEYNPNTSFGIEVGSWFTLAGRNTPSFATGVTTLYWFF